MEKANSLGANGEISRYHSRWRMGALSRPDDPSATADGTDPELLRHCDWLFRDLLRVVALRHGRSLSRRFGFSCFAWLLLALRLRLFFGSGSLVIGTNEERSRFEILLEQVRTTALWTLLGNRLVRGSEVALRIIRTAIEDVAATPRFLLDQLAVFALRTLHADEVLLHVLAFRISAAGDELAIASVTQHHIASALRADFFQRNVRNFLALIEPPRGLAVRIAGASHELPKASAF